MRAEHLAADINEALVEHQNESRRQPMENYMKNHFSVLRHQSA